jgi:GT2 family glycosyltransferase
MPSLSVIIPAYNCLDQVLRCYHSVRVTTDPALTEVLIQDDASPDYDGPLVLGPDCQRNPQNLGFPGNCHAGAGRARGDVLFFLNQDTTATSPGWDVTLLALFEAEDTCAAAGPTLLFPDGRVQSAGGAYDAACQPYHLALGYANPDWEPIHTPRPVSWVTGAAFAIRRAAWEQLGGFDRAYGRGYFEDVDLCVRVRLAGWDVWHEPRVRFYHAVGSTGGNARFRQNVMEFRRRWVESGIVQPDVRAVKERFWV